MKRFRFLGVVAITLPLILGGWSSVWLAPENGGDRKSEDE